MKKHILYRHYDEKGQLLYVGISLTLFERLNNHKAHSHWFCKIKTITIERFDTRQEVITAEKKAIKKEKPTHNVQFSDLQKITPNPVLRVHQIADKLGVCRRKMYRMIDDGRFPVPPIKGTKPLLFNSKFVEEWMKDNWG